MKLSYKHIVLLGVLVAGLVSCTQDDPTNAVSLELNLCLPAQEVAYHAPSRRSMGDPGTSEVLEYPKYAYIFVTKQGEMVWRKEEIILEAENWEKTRYYGQFATDGDYIYRYNKRSVILLMDQKPKGRIYAICSNKRLTLSSSLTDITTLNDILNLKFNTAPDSIQENLQNIYSTPYNYTKEDGNYYCTYDCSEGNVYSADLLLYHVASKVDINWNVDEAERLNKASKTVALRLTYMEARYLFNGQAYCFKPMKNEVATMPTSGYDIEDIVTKSDEGLWWEGRTYFYTIPYYVAGEPSYFPLQMILCTNGVDKEDGYKLTLKQPMDTSDVFVPWLRGNFNLTAPLENKSETKIASLPTP